MKKISIILLSILCPSSLFAQETLSLAAVPGNGAAI